MHGSLPLPPQPTVIVACLWSEPQKEQFPFHRKRNWHGETKNFGEDGGGIKRVLVLEPA